MEAAVHVIGERGYCDTRIADIAARAGTSSALVIYYFESKDRLLAEALSYSEEQFFDASSVMRFRDGRQKERWFHIHDLNAFDDFVARF